MMRPRSDPNHEFLFWAWMLSLVITRDHYHEVRRRWGQDFKDTLAGEMLQGVNEEIDELVKEIDLLRFF